MTDPLTEAWQELETIDWVNGLRPMPQHLVELGTVVHRFTHELVYDPLDLVATTSPELSILPTTIRPLPVLLVETRVWGELT